MSCTGHSSTKGVRAYKRICEQQQQITSEILNGKKKKEDIVDTDLEVKRSEGAENDATVANISTVQVKQQNSTEVALNSKQLKLPFTLNISSSNVTFNINYTN